MLSFESFFSASTTNFRIFFEYKSLFVFESSAKNTLHDLKL